MPYSSGTELDCRVGAATEFPVTLANFSIAGLSHVFAAAYPTSPNIYPFYWNPHLPYMLWNEVPANYRVIAGITVPAFSTDLKLAQDAANRVGYDYGTETDPCVICNGIVDASA